MSGSPCLEACSLPADALILMTAGILDPATGESTQSEAIVISNGRILGRLPKSLAASLPVEKRVWPSGWIVPGFVNLHEYLSVDPDRPEPMGRMFSPDIASRAWSAARSLSRDLRSGVTTLRVMGEGDGFDIRAAKAVAEREIDGPSLVTSGFPITPSHGHQRGTIGFDGESAIRHAVRTNLQAGCDWIKVVLTGGVNSLGLGPRSAAYTRDEIRFAVDEAWRAGRPVAGAAHGGPAVRMAAEMGVRTIEHAALFDDEDIEAVAQNDVAVVLTLSRFFHPDGIRKSARANPVILANLDRACAAMRVSVPKLVARGVRIGVGTDNMHGYIADEVRLLSELGAGVDKALKAATATGALVLGRTDIGGLNSGMVADLVILQNDPRHDLSALSSPVEVFAAGRPVLS